MAHSIAVGVFDWVNFPKQQGFYPDDIPEDWKLSFYSNEFNSACLSLAGLNSQIEFLSEGFSELPEAFELSLYIEHSDQIPILQSLLQIEDCRIYSLIVDATEGNNLLHKENLCSVSSAELTIYEFSDVWTPANALNQNTCMAIFPAAENMRQYRTWIEQWLKHADSDSSTEHKTLWLQGADTSYQQLSEIRMLTELLGY